MSTTPLVVRDERTVAVENAGYKWAFIFLAFALFIDILYRCIVRHEAVWDLIALVFVASVVGTVYQIRQKTLPHGWIKTGTLIALLAAVVGVIAMAIVLWLRS